MHPLGPRRPGGRLGGAGGLKQRVDAISRALDLDGALSMPAAVKAANELVGLEAKGSLLEQVGRLDETLGLQ